MVMVDGQFVQVLLFLLLPLASSFLLLSFAFPLAESSKEVLCLFVLALLPLVLVVQAASILLVAVRL